MLQPIATCAVLRSQYLNAVARVAKHDLEAQYHDRCEAVLQMGGNLGWGLGDALAEIYGESLLIDPEHE